MKIGLVLGSGGARGMAHIGVLQVLQQAGIKPHCVVGSSMGALVGSLYVSGKLDAFTQKILDMDMRELFQHFVQISFPRSGLIDGAKIEKLLRSFIGNEKLEEFPIPFCVMTTDVQTGEECVLCEGDAVKAVRASIAIPGIFTPVIKNNLILVDGGLVNPLPVNLARKLGADYVIAVDVNCKPDKLPLTKKKKTTAPEGRFKKWFSKDGTPSIFDILGNAARIVERNMTRTHLKTDPPDMLIQPEVGQVNFMDFHKARECIQEGVRAARTKQAALKSLSKK